MRRLQHGAHAVDRNEKGQPAFAPDPLPARLDAGQQQARGLHAGVGHVHMRIGPERDQAVGFPQHLTGDVGVQIQAGDDRHVRPRDLAHAGKQFALAIVQVFGDHRAVQVQIDGVVAAGPRRVEDFAGDALVGVAGHVGRRAGARPDYRVNGMALFHHGVDEASGRDVDLAQRQHVLAAHHGGKALAADEVLVARLGRGEGVGFMLETSDQNMHDFFLWGGMRTQGRGSERLGPCRPGYRVCDAPRPPRQRMRTQGQRGLRLPPGIQ
ncbi:hypothetical protein D3C85_861330 [compost metagenome]